MRMRLPASPWRQALARNGLIDSGKTTGFAGDVIKSFDVRTTGPAAEARSLSGGNLQKFIVGREIMLAPKVLVLAQPTWGVDIGAAMLIRQAIIDMRDQGVAVLVLSEEIEELFMMSDRIAVIAKGRLSRAVNTSETSVNQVGVWMSGDFNHTDAAAHAEQQEGEPYVQA